LMAKIVSLGDSLKSRLEIGLTGSFSFNWPIVRRAGDSECPGFPFPMVLLGDKDLLCTSAGLAECARCGQTLGVRPCKIPNFLRKPESLYQRGSPWISGYRVHLIDNNTKSYIASHKIIST
jgi:hypothetical protein